MFVINDTCPVVLRLTNYIVPKPVGTPFQFNGIIL
jgi:hypothetical protein